jgi:hypothetical protein
MDAPYHVLSGQMYTADLLVSRMVLSPVRQLWKALEQFSDSPLPYLKPRAGERLSLSNYIVSPLWAIGDVSGPFFAYIFL